MKRTLGVFANKSTQSVGAALETGPPKIIGVDTRAEPVALETLVSCVRTPMDGNAAGRSQSIAAKRMVCDGREQKNSFPCRR